MQPVVNRLEEDYGDQVKFVYLDAEHEGKEAFRASRLPGHPSFLLVRPDGQEVWRSFGIVSYEDIEAAILDALD
jgi:hypothetical protein